MGGAFYSYKEDDEYSIGRLIGGGAFGKVYELYRFKKPCGLAIKQIGIEKSRMDHIQREVDIMKIFMTVSHNNIVVCKWININQSCNRVSIIMELCDESLQDQIELVRDVKLRPFSDFYIWLVLSHTSEGLAYLHYKKIVHRDIKPENILSLKGTMKLADFGLAKFMDPDNKNQTICGTPGYIAPECLTGQPATPKSDVFSLGKTIMDMIEVHPNMYTHSESLVQLVTQMISINPNDRPSCGEISTIAASHSEANYAQTYQSYNALKSKVSSEKAILDILIQNMEIQKNQLNNLEVELSRMKNRLFYESNVISNEREKRGTNTI